MKEPQIFTSLQRQNQPVDLEIMGDLEAQLQVESQSRSIRESISREIELGGYPFTVEVADTPEKRSKGLSGRKYMPDGTGMLFKMDVGPASFHMKNTHIPLDILYLDDTGVVIMKDLMCPHIGKSRCDDQVASVLELPAGTCDELGIEPGDTIFTENLQEIRALVRESLVYQWQKPGKIRDIVYRPWSLKFYEQVRQIKERVHESRETLGAFEKEMLSTDIGEFGICEGQKVPLDIPVPAELVEAEYRGKDVDLNKPKRGGTAKYYVYVRDPKTKNVKKVTFGSKGMSVKINDPDATRSFVARHGCKSAKKEDKTKAGYWSCRLPRYWKALGLKKTGKQWW